MDFGIDGNTVSPHSFHEVGLGLTGKNTALSAADVKDEALLKVAGVPEAIDRVAKKTREREIEEHIRSQGLMLNQRNIKRAEQELKKIRDKEQQDLERVHGERKDRSPSPAKSQRSQRSKSSRARSRKQSQYGYPQTSAFVRIDELTKYERTRRISQVSDPDIN